MEKSVKDVLIERGKQYDELNAKIKQLEARISELEAACVMGGDGKPLRIGHKAYYWNDYHEKVCEVPINSMCKSGKDDRINTYPHQISARNLYSSPEDVPEGGK